MVFSGVKKKLVSVARTTISPAKSIIEIVIALMFGDWRREDLFLIDNILTYYHKSYLMIIYKHEQTF